MATTLQFIRIQVAILVMLELLLFLSGAGEEVGFTREIAVGLWLTATAAWVAFEILTKYGGGLPYYVAGLGGLALIVDAGGNALGWYDRLAWYDVLVHGVSGWAGMLVMVVFWRRVVEKNHWRLPQGMVWYVAAVSVVAAGVGFEVVEFGLDWALDSERWLGSGGDTVIDLLSGAVGAVVGLATVRVMESR